MKRFRKVIFWCHLATGVTGGIIVLVMSLTGVLLAYEKQVTAWADTRGYQVAPPAPGASRLPVDALVSVARAGRDGLPSTLTIRSGAEAPAEVGFGRGAVVFLNPYTGEVLGEGSKGTRAFFQTVTDWHRWLGAQGDNRAVARAITGACNLGFLFLVMSGFYLWFPQNWARRQFRNVIWFRRGLSPKARDFNWHNVIGFWCLVPLFVVVLSAVPISYTWASNLVYRLVGEAPPAPRGAPGQAPGGGPQPGSPRGEDGGRGVYAEGLDGLLARAEQQTPGWRSIAMQLPTAANAPVTFTIDEGNGGQPQKRAQLTLARADGAVVRYEPYSSYSLGRRLRTFLRFAHTGEVAGAAGQFLAGVASLGGVFLVWTGLMLAWRRLRAWRGRRAAAATAATAEAG